MITLEQNKIFLGFIQLPTDYTLDMEINDILKQVDGVSWRLQKMYPTDNVNITSEMYKELKNNIKKAAKCFIPKQNKDNEFGTLKVISLACTSMSFVLTTDVIHRELYLGYPTITNDMASSVIHAIRALKGRQIGLLTPYIDEVHQKNIDFFSNYGIDVIIHKNIGLKNDSLTSSISPNSIIGVIENMLKNNSVDVFVIGCSAFRVTSYGFIDNLEKTFNIPFVTSNQAMIWNSLKKALPEKNYNVTGYGKLFLL